MSEARIDRVEARIERIEETVIRIDERLAATLPQPCRVTARFRKHALPR
jgi:hypothetical protein